MDELQVGKTYEVILQDCCIEGNFTSKLIKIDEEDRIYFENGVELNSTRWGCSFEEVENNDSK
jgi:hypothetical protein